MNSLLVLSHLWPIIGKPAVVARKEVLYVYPASYLFGTLFIDRKNAKSSIRTLSAESEAIKENSKKLLIFPEGKRHESNTLLPFKKGSFHIAIESQSTIQPVVTSRYSFLDSKKKIFSSGKCVLNMRLKMLFKRFICSRSQYNIYIS